MTSVPDAGVPRPADRAARMRATARDHMLASAPHVPELHLFETGLGHHVFVSDRSRLYDVEAGTFRALGAALAAGRAAGSLQALGLAGSPAIDDEPLAPPPIHALSLAVAQKCNLGCTYCYADGGAFGGAAKNMSQAVAERAVEGLVAGAEPGAKLNLAFLGGEPLANRAVLQAATRHAIALAGARGIAITFSITTNGTLVTGADADFFEEHGFAVTVSLDGLRDAHDAQRPFKGGGGSYDRVMRQIRPLLAQQRRMQVSARVTVTPKNLALREALDEFVAAGFHSVGFSPLLSSGAKDVEMQREDLELMLGEMIDCGREFERRTLLGDRYPFSNLTSALREIERGTHRPYPCGAGAGYLGVSADGDLAACHRFVGDEAGAMGTIETGVDRGRQAAWLDERHVHRQEPCRECWARYLCGGGCHHEAIRRGRPACDYIRGWLHYALEAYLRLSQARAERPERAASADAALGGD